MAMKVKSILLYAFIFGTITVKILTQENPDDLKEDSFITSKDHNIEYLIQEEVSGSILHEKDVSSSNDHIDDYISKFYPIQTIDYPDIEKSSMFIDFHKHLSFVIKKRVYIQADLSKYFSETDMLKVTEEMEKSGLHFFEFKINFSTFIYYLIQEKKIDRDLLKECSSKIIFYSEANNKEVLVKQSELKPVSVHPFETLDVLVSSNELRQHCKPSIENHEDLGEDRISVNQSLSLLFDCKFRLEFYNKNEKSYYMNKSLADFYVVDEYNPCGSGFNLCIVSKNIFHSLSFIEFLNKDNLRLQEDNRKLKIDLGRVLTFKNETDHTFESKDVLIKSIKTKLYYKNNTVVFGSNEKNVHYSNIKYSSDFIETDIALTDDNFFYFEEYSNDLTDKILKLVCYLKDTGAKEYKETIIIGSTLIIPINAELVIAKRKEKQIYNYFYVSLVALILLFMMYLYRLKRKTVALDKSKKNDDYMKDFEESMRRLGGTTDRKNNEDYIGISKEDMDD